MGRKDEEWRRKDGQKGWWEEGKGWGGREEERGMGKKDKGGRMRVEEE